MHHNSRAHSEYFIAWVLHLCRFIWSCFSGIRYWRFGDHPIAMTGARKYSDLEFVSKIISIIQCKTGVSAVGNRIRASLSWFSLALQCGSYPVCHGWLWITKWGLGHMSLLQNEYEKWQCFSTTALLNGRSVPIYQNNFRVTMFWLHQNSRNDRCGIGLVPRQHDVNAIKIDPTPHSPTPTPPGFVAFNKIHI